MTTPFRSWSFLVIGLIFFAGGFNFDGDKDVNVNLETLKLDAQKVTDGE